MDHVDTDMFQWEEEIQGTHFPMLQVSAADKYVQIFYSDHASIYTQFKRKTQNWNEVNPGHLEG